MNIFTTIVVQPIFNLLVLIYSILPGHNFGVAIIIFTVIVRLLMWPLVKKQITQAKAMRELQPEIKKIKESAKGNRAEQQRLTMELYKEREINPMASFGIVLVQLPIIIGLYSSVRRIVNDPHSIITFSYPAIHNLAWIQTITHDISKFDDSLVGVINLGQKAVGPGGIYWPAMVIVIASAIAQFFQAKQLMPQSKDSRGLRQILSDAGKGKNTDQSEVNAAVGKGTQYLIPGFVFIFGLSFPAALPLYWLTSSCVAYLQQAKILKEDTTKAEDSVRVKVTSTVVDKPKKQKSSKKRNSAKKRRK